MPDPRENTSGSPGGNPTVGIPREPTIPTHLPGNPVKVPSSQAIASPASNTGPVPPIFRHGSGLILTPPVPKPDFGSSSPPVLHPGSGPVLTPPRIPVSGDNQPTLNPGGGGGTTPSSSDTILPPGPVGSHTLTLFASSPGRIWSMHRNAYIVPPNVLPAYRLAQARLYPWIVASGIAVYDEDPIARHGTLYWLVDFVKKVKDVAGVEPPFLTLLYALRNSTDPKVKVTVQDALTTWNTFGKNAVETHGSTPLFFFDVEKRTLLTLTDSTMNELRQGSYISNLDTLPSILANVTIAEKYDPFGRVTSPQTTNLVSTVARVRMVQGHLLAQANLPGLGTTIPAPGTSTTIPLPGPSSTIPASGPPTTTPTPGSSAASPTPGPSTTTPQPGSSTTNPTKPPSGPSDPGWSGSVDEARSKYHWSVFKAVGSLIAGAGSFGKYLGPRFVPAFFGSLEEGSLVGTVASAGGEVGIIEGIGGLAPVFEGLVVAAAALTLSEALIVGGVVVGIIYVAHELLDSKDSLDAKTKLHSCNAEYPGVIPTLSLADITNPSPGLPTNVGGGSPGDDNPTLSTPVHGGSGGDGPHGPTGGQPGSAGPHGPQIGPSGSGSSHPTSSPGSGNSPGNFPGGQPTGQPIDDPNRPSPGDRPGAGGQPEGPTGDPNTTNPHQPGSGQPNNPNIPSPDTPGNHPPPNTPNEPPQGPTQPTPNPTTNPEEPPEDPDTSPGPEPSPPPKDPPKSNPPPKDPPKASPTQTPPASPPDGPVDPNLPIAHHGGGSGGGVGGGGGGAMDPNTGRPTGPNISAGDVPDQHDLPSDNPVKHGPGSGRP